MQKIYSTIFVIAISIIFFNQTVTANTPGLEYTVEAFNWDSGSYDVVGVQTETFNTDQLFPIFAEDHVSSSCDLRTRVGSRRVGFTILFPWQIQVYHAVWTE